SAATTRCPTRSRLTSGATSRISPETSVPGVKGSGGLRWYLPDTKRLTAKPTPAWQTRMRTCPGPSAVRAMRCSSSSLQCPQWVQTSPSKSCMSIVLVRLDADLPDHFGPLVVVVRQNLGELLGRVADGYQVQVLEPLRHLGFFHDACHFARQRIDTLLGNACGEQQPHPGVWLESLVAQLSEGGDIRQQLRAFAPG